MLKIVMGMAVASQKTAINQNNQLLIRVGICIARL